MRNIITLLSFFLVLVSCSESNTNTILTITPKPSKKSGTLKIIDYTKFPEVRDPNLPRITSNLSWTLDENSEVIIKISKNLTSNPYNIKLDIDVDKRDVNSPKLSFVSDFDRKIEAGDRYRLISTINLFSSTSFVPGNTGGQVKFVEYNDAFGFSIGSELEITIANPGTAPFSDFSQKLILIGTYTPDNNNGSGITLGNFEITIEGDDLIDLSVF